MWVRCEPVQACHCPPVRSTCHPSTFAGPRHLTHYGAIRGGGPWPCERCTGRRVPQPMPEVVIAAASKNRLVWSQLPAPVRQQIERIAGCRVAAASSQPGGFSPGLASRLSLANGTQVFAKAIGNDWPVEASFHRSEAVVAAHLPSTIPAPRLWGSFDDGDWVGLVFDDIDGRAPAQPSNRAEMARIVSALARLADVATPSPVALARDHPRLGGWTDVVRDDASMRRLPAESRWAADHLALLVELERDGLEAARGESLVHFDLYPHNVLLSADRVSFVDWPHARLGNPLVDLVSVLSTVAVTGHDPGPDRASARADAQGGPARTRRSHRGARRLLYRGGAFAGSARARCGRRREACPRGRIPRLARPSVTVGGLAGAQPSLCSVTGLAHHAHRAPFDRESSTPRRTR